MDHPWLSTIPPVPVQDFVILAKLEFVRSLSDMKSIDAGNPPCSVQITTQATGEQSTEQIATQTVVVSAAGVQSGAKP